MDVLARDEPPRHECAVREFFASRDQDRGLGIDPVYYGECLTNARGGISTAGATQYEGLLDLPLTLDFERLRVPVPGTGTICRLSRGSSEKALTALEIFYRAAITDRVSLRPDLQYIVSTSGIYRDAVAVGLRFELAS